jgi:hypothetical protein
MVSEIKKGMTIQPNPGTDSITMETTTGDMAKMPGKLEIPNEAQPKSAGSQSLAAEQKGILHMEATLRRSVVEQDLDQPDMAMKAYQHNQTDLKFLKSKPHK